ncbi:MAG: hypothetical protein COA81_11060 [Alphaproteobacteria bacterium]|nr:MAG: hypothetical protein COA81_11060 [Alphaproteobacteria bacterium]
MAIKIGVIAEGITDQVVYDKFISEHFKDEDFDLHFIKEQPGDATSASPEGGWTQVQNWCRNNKSVFRNAVLTQGLFKDPSNESKRDIFLFHLDSDAAEVIMLAANENGYDLTTPLKRGAYVRQKLTEWLWPGESNPNVSAHVVSIAVDAVEAWMICAINNDPDIETKDNLEKLLVAEIYEKVVYKIDPRANSPKKDKKTYEEICQRTLSGVSNIYANCSYFKQTCDDIEYQITRINT